jgi:hypothetical protein
MDTLNLNQALLIFAWFPLTAFLTIILLVARFYQNQAQERTYYIFFAVPILLFGLAVAHGANVNQVVGDPVGDLLMFAGGLLLVGLVLVLYRRMTSGR